MGGVILFADDKVFGDSFEKKFFHSLLGEKKYPVLAVDNLELLEKTTHSISTFKALIVDWNFEKKDEEPIEGLEIPNETSAEFLLKNEIFSLIYIYSDKEISNTADGKKLIAKYGTKIKFKQKTNTASQTEESVIQQRKEILEEIEKFEVATPSLKVPFVWSQSINKSMQEIFRDLEKADPNWIKDIYYSAVRKSDKSTGVPSEVEVDPNIQVINLFQYLLAEKLIQKTELKKSIEEYSITNFKSVTSAESYVQLFQKLYYTETVNTDEVMTGDVFKITDTEFGVIISPECDITALKKSKLEIEFLVFKSGDFATNFDKTFTDDKQKEQAFNQIKDRLHLLPSFPFEAGKNKDAAFIDFRIALKLVKFSDLKIENRTFKLNSPYIQQLRQRYLAYVGRVGVPGIPSNIVNYFIQ